jgi:hypothetical protein
MLTTIVQWLFDFFVVKIYDALKAFGMPHWLAVTTLVVVFGGLLAYVIVAF